LLRSHVDVIVGNARQQVEEHAAYLARHGRAAEENL
jgi:hypothetical protein